MMQPCLIHLLTFCVVTAGIASASTSPENSLSEAIEIYNAAFEIEDRDERLQQFRRSEILFRQAASQLATPSAELFVNLGNAALCAEHLGPAISAFHAALSIDPNHSRAQQNLEHARTLLPDWVPRPERDFGDSVSFLSRYASVRSETLSRCAGGTFFLGAVLAAGAIRLGRNALRNAAVASMAVWLLLVTAATWKHYSPQTITGVVIAAEVIARSADSARSPARLPEALPSGTEIEIIEDRGQWVRVRLYDGRDAWLPNSAIAQNNA